MFDNIYYDKHVKNIINTVIWERISCVSLDVFDTLIMRNYKPELLRFKEVSDLYRKSIFSDIHNDAADVLFPTRVLAHKISYNLQNPDGQYNEANINQIFELYLRLLGQIYSIELINKMLEMELEYELKNTSMNRHMKYLIDFILKKGKKIVFISDMYFNEKSLNYLIKNKLSDELPGRVYVSSDYNITKREGGLYKRVILLNDLQRNEILHIGDNYSSDYVMPKKLGLHAYYLPRTKIYRKVCKTISDYIANRYSNKLW